MVSKIFFFVFCLTIFAKPSLQVSFEEDLTITYEQKLTLDAFRELMSTRLPHDYMKTDIYLIRFLRDRNFDIPAAERMMLESLKWREENDIDNILNEDWTHFDQEYRIGVEGCDKEGRPVLSLLVGDWDVRRAVVAGQSRLLTRYMAKLLEEAVVHVRRMQDAGLNITQGIMAYDMNGFNLAQQGCPGCIPIYLSLLTMYERYYPGYAHKIIAINTPQIAFPLWELYKPLMSPQVRNILFIYGRDRGKWRRALMSDVDENQLTRTFGGSKLESLDVEDLRAGGGHYVCPK